MIILIIILMCIFLCITTFYLINKIKKINQKLEKVDNELKKYQKYTMDKVFNIKKEIPKIIHKEIGYIEFAQPIDGTKKY